MAARAAGTHSAPSYLKNHPSGYIFRYCIPKDVQQVVKRTELRYSLRTGKLGLAKARARAMATAALSGTADETDRQEFAVMVSAILRNGVNTILVESLDRLAREYRIQEQLLIYLASKGITLIAANTGENIT